MASKTPIDEKEPAEGSREVVDRELERQDQKQGRDPGKEPPQSKDKAQNKQTG